MFADAFTPENVKNLLNNSNQNNQNNLKNTKNRINFYTRKFPQLAQFSEQYKRRMNEIYASNMNNDNKVKSIKKLFVDFLTKSASAINSISTPGNRGNNAIFESV